jgi:nucleoside-diphosphate-sugar epimerase
MTNKISIFGSTGFIGNRFVELFNNEVVSIPRNEVLATTDNILYLISTVDNYNIHNNLHVDIDTNLSVLMNVLEANKNNKNMVFNFVSSWFVYGQNNDIPFSEDSTVCNPTGFYSITKHCAEQMLICFCNTFNIKYRIFRLSNVLGESDKKISRKKNALQFLIREAVNNRELHLYYGGEVLRDYIYVDDACEAIKFCMNVAPTNQIINVGNGTPFKFLDLIEKTIEKSKSSSNIINIEPSIFHNIVQVRHSYLNINKLKSYGFKPKYKMDDVLDKLIMFYKTEQTLADDILT